jgi:hypothetical protein
MAMLDILAPWAGLVGLIGLAGLAGFKSPVDKTRAGGGIRWLALVGLFGLCGFWIPGAGAMGAAGALGLWNHQSPRLGLWGNLGWAWVIGLPFLFRFLAG